MTVRSAVAVLLLCAPLLASCRTPVTCAEGQVARKETLCPPCETIENPPPGYCPCSEGWVCRDTPERVEQKRQEQRRRQLELSQRPVEPAHPVDLQRRRLEQQNVARRNQAVAKYCDAVGPGGCAQGTWSKLEETGEVGAGGLLVTREVCVPFDPPVQRRCVTEEEREARRQEAQRMREQSMALVARAREVCRAHRCAGKQTPAVRIVCVTTRDDGAPTRYTLAEPTCELLAKLQDDTRFGCRGELIAEKVCQPPPQPKGVCNVKPNECCQPDGRVVRPCGPITAPGSDCNASATCGRGGWCSPCRCLPPDTRIATPSGQVPVRALRVGDEVIVLDASGRRRAAHVRRVERSAVVGTHEVLGVELSDGRTITASGPHPLADGRALSSLTTGDRVDGARVVRVVRVPYWADATWDLLTDVPGAAYFADGVPLRSTLEEAAAPSAAGR